MVKASAVDNYIGASNESVSSVRLREVWDRSAGSGAGNPPSVEAGLGGTLVSEPAGLQHAGQASSASPHSLSSELLDQLALLAAIRGVAFAITIDVLQFSAFLDLLAQLILGKKSFNKLGLLRLSFCSAVTELFSCMVELRLKRRDDDNIGTLELLEGIGTFLVESRELGPSSKKITALV
ncbi:hypothetical protein HG530_012216 [Fusarium avenaceum]|nr:hypothetical protein HG530_012216 [Fusarium avenaceum]